MGIFLKDPAATLDYSVDWAAGYLDGDAIASSAWSVEPDEPGGIAVTAQVVSTTRTGVTLAGGIAGHVYRITNRVALSDERSDERSLTVRVEQR